MQGEVQSRGEIILNLRDGNGGGVKESLLRKVSPECWVSCVSQLVEQDWAWGGWASRVEWGWAGGEEEVTHRGESRNKCTEAISNMRCMEATASSVLLEDKDWDRQCKRWGWRYGQG